MLIDRIKKKVEFFLNVEMRGNFTPSKFELALHNAMQTRNEEYLYDLNRLLNRQNKGLISNGINNTPDSFSEKISHYLEEDEITPETNGRFVLPNDLKYLDEVAVKYQVDQLDVPLIDKKSDVEFCKNKREFNVLKNLATKQYPVSVIIGNNLLLAPSYDNATSIDVTYLRKVKYPKWTYQVVGGVELFNPSATDFQDADIHSSEEDEMVMRVLKAFGVNLKEADIQAFSKQEEVSDFNQENTS